MSAWKTPKILGQAGGAAVVGIVALSLLASTILHKMAQNNVANGVQEFFALTATPKGKRADEREQAEAMLVEASENDPENPGPYLLIASSAYHEGKLDKAEKFFLRAAKVSEENPDPWLGAASVKVHKAGTERSKRKEHLERANEYLDKATATGAAFEAEVLKGAIALLKGRNSEARKIYKSLDAQLKDIGEGFPGRDVMESFYWNKAMAELLSNSTDCLQSFRQALQFRADWPEASDVLCRAMCSFLTAKTDEAETKKRIGMCLEIRGQFYMRVEDSVRANRYGLNRSQLGQLNNAIGMAYYRNKDYLAASKAFDLSLRADRNDITYNRNQGLTYQKLLEGEKNKAKIAEYHGKAARFFAEAAKQAVALEVKDKKYIWELYVNGAWHFTYVRQKNEALNALKKSLDLEVDKAESCRALGCVHLTFRSKLGAKKWLTKAIEEGHPDSAELEIIVQSLD